MPDPSLNIARTHREGLWLHPELITAAADLGEGVLLLLVRLREEARAVLALGLAAGVLKLPGVHASFASELSKRGQMPREDNLICQAFCVLRPKVLLRCLFAPSAAAPAFLMKVLVEINSVFPWPCFAELQRLYSIFSASVGPDLVRRRVFVRVLALRAPGDGRAGTDEEFQLFSNVASVNTDLLEKIAASPSVRKLLSPVDAGESIEELFGFLARHGIDPMVEPWRRRFSRMGIGPFLKNYVRSDIAHNRPEITDPRLRIISQEQVRGLALRYRNCLYARYHADILFGARFVLHDEAGNLLILLRKMEAGDNSSVLVVEQMEALSGRSLSSLERIQAEARIRAGTRNVYLRPERQGWLDFLL